VHIDLPNGDKLVPNAEFADKLGVVVRTLNNYDRKGLPFIKIGGLKYRPLKEGLEWVASRIERPNRRKQAAAVASATKSAPQTRRAASEGEKTQP